VLKLEWAANLERGKSPLSVVLLSNMSVHGPYIVYVRF